MPNVKLIFQGTERSKTDETELEVFANVYNEICISIEDQNSCSIICLDKSTAIRLVRELKKQIGFLMESEVNNV